jgi:hypothetical protein
MAIKIILCGYNFAGVVGKPKTLRRGIESFKIRMQRCVEGTRMNGRGARKGTLLVLGLLILLTLVTRVGAPWRLAVTNDEANHHLESWRNRYRSASVFPIFFERLVESGHQALASRLRPYLTSNASSSRSAYGRTLPFSKNWSLDPSVSGVSKLTSSMSCTV